MIRFRKRDIGCWKHPTLKEDPMELTFNSEDELLEYVRAKLPFTREPTDKGKVLRISDRGAVCWWTCIGWIDHL